MKRLLAGSLVSVVALSGCDRFLTQIPVGNTLGRAASANAECERLDKLPVTVEEEVAVGDAVAVPVAQRAGGLYLDGTSTKGAKAELTAYVNRVGKNLAAYSQRPELQWSFGVLDSPGVNAFSTPGGRVFVTRGLLASISTEAELAGVLGHEIAHVIERHGIQAYRQVKGDTCRKAVLGQIGDSVATSARTSIASSMSEVLTPQAAGFVDLNLGKNHELLRALASGLADQILTRGYSEEDEFKADQGGVELTMLAGYSPSPFIELLGKLPTGPKGVEHHPAAGKRQEKLRTYVASATRPGSGDGFPGALAGISPEQLPTVPVGSQLQAARTE